MNGGILTTSISYVDGMQAVVLISEMIKNNFGMAARWLLVSGDASMLYAGSDANYLYHPHTDFYYLSYLQKFYGDHAISAVSSNTNILCYASKFSSGETGVIVINEGTANQVVNIDTKAIGVGQHYDVLSFTGGTTMVIFRRMYLSMETARLSTIGDLMGICIVFRRILIPLKMV